MTVSRWEQPDMTAHSAAAYKAALDAAIAVLANAGAGFAPSAEAVPSMKVALAAGAVFNRATGALSAVAAQTTGTLAAPGSNAWIVRVYVTEAGAVATVTGTAAASPVAPAYPAGAFPVARVTIAAGQTTITNADITDERAWAGSYGTPRNTYLVEASGTFTQPAGATFFRVTGAAAGGSGGGGATNAGGTSHAGGGGGSGGASVINRLWGAENLTLVVGAGVAGGASGATNGSNGADGTNGGNSSITGVSSGQSVTLSGGNKGTKATAATPTAGTGGASVAGPSGGYAGQAGSNGTTGASATGGTSGGTGLIGSTATRSPGVAGGTISPAARGGLDGTRGAGGSGAVGSGAYTGGRGGDGFWLVEVF